jgi:3-oxoacyl-[acyl-carrier-protein] synthase II
VVTAKTRTVEYKRVVVTGVGVVSPIGIGKGPFLESLLAGRSGVRLIERFDTTEYPVTP